MRFAGLCRNTRIRALLFFLRQPPTVDSEFFTARDSLAGTDRDLAPLFCPPCTMQSHRPRAGGRDRRASLELRCGGWFHRSEVPFGEGTGLFGRQVSVEINAASGRPRLSSLPLGREFNLMRNLSSFRGCGTAVRGTSRRCGGGFAEQVAGNVEKGETATLLRERLEIRLDENLDGLFAGVDLDTDGSVAEVNLVASSVLASNDGVGHYRLASQGSPAISDHLRPVQAPKAEPLCSGAARAVGST